MIWSILPEGINTWLLHLIAAVFNCQPSESSALTIQTPEWKTQSWKFFNKKYLLAHRPLNKDVYMNWYYMNMAWFSKKKKYIVVRVLPMIIAQICTIWFADHGLLLRTGTPPEKQIMISLLRNQLQIHKFCSRIIPSNMKFM